MEHVPFRKGERPEQSSADALDAGPCSLPGETCNVQPIAGAPTMTAYDPNNVFAKILRGELPCEKVYEDEHTLALMDIMPRADGHVLVIPKAPSRNILDVQPEDLARLPISVQKSRRR